MGGHREWRLDVTAKETKSVRQSICAIGSATYTSYEWEVRNGLGYKWVVWKRYSDFATLDKVLSRRYPKEMCKVTSIPGKTAWGNNSATVVERRRQSLDDYLKGLCKQDVIMNCSELVDFLEVPIEAALDADDDDYYRGVRGGAGSPGTSDLSMAPTSTSSINVRAWQQEAEAKWGERDSLVF